MHTCNIFINYIGDILYFCDKKFLRGLNAFISVFDVMCSRGKKGKGAWTYESVTVMKRTLSITGLFEWEKWGE
jgi:hypothetical protein